MLMLTVPQQRANDLQATLEGCLTWQERCAGGVCDYGVVTPAWLKKNPAAPHHLSEERTKYARGTYAEAEGKRDFLWDVLERCVAAPHGWPPSHTSATSTRLRDTSHVVLDQDCYARARTMAAVFRAAMSARTPWHSYGRFRYPRGAARRAALAPAGQGYSLPAFAALRKRLAVFMIIPPSQHTPRTSALRRRAHELSCGGLSPRDVARQLRAVANQLGVNAAEKRTLRRYGCALAFYLHGPKLLSAAAVARELRRLAGAFADVASDLFQPNPKPDVVDLVNAQVQQAYCAAGGRADDIARVLDRLWRRATPCDYRKHCLEYKEFYYSPREPPHDNSPPERPHPRFTGVAAEKLEMLRNAESAVAQLPGLHTCRCPAGTPECTRASSDASSTWTGMTEDPPKDPPSGGWTDVARSWVCRCFRKRIYQWTAATTISDVRGERDLVAETTKILKYIAQPHSAIYRRVRGEVMTVGSEKRECFKEVKDRDIVAAVRMATGGADPRMILRHIEEWEGGSYNLMAFFFVAATARKAPRLQDCWFVPECPE